MAGTVGRLLGRLDHVKQVGPGRWMAKSPLSPDQKTGSVSIRELDDGRVLIHDFAGGSTAEILDAVGLQMADLFPEGYSSDPGTRKRPNQRPWFGRDVTRALGLELVWVLIILDELAAGGRPDPEMRARAAVAARRLRAALEMCDG